MLWKNLLTVVLLLVVGVLAVEFIPLAETRWVGGYDLTVHLDTPTDPPSVVICAATLRRDNAEDTVANLRTLPPETRLTPALDIGGCATVADPFAGEPLTVHIKTVGRSSAFDRDLSRTQYRFLVVGAEWPDGRRVWKVVEIPDGRVSREVRVSLP
jgi:hypothetical protein